MKIGLFIFPLHHSHGCILQTFALYTVLCNQGHQVTIIDKQPDKLGFGGNLKQITKRFILKYILRKYKGDLFYLGYDSPKLMSSLTPFIRTNFGKDLISSSSHNFLNCIDWSRFQAIIVGSDQTWRPKYVPNIYNFFLDFVPAQQSLIRMSYAASMGTDTWEYTNKETQICKSLITKFKAVSVREKSSIILCKKHLNVTAEHVLDPTLLLKANDYSKLIVEDTTIPKNSVCYYLLDSEKNKLNVVNRISTDLHLTKVRINKETENYLAKTTDRIPPTIDRWISGFIRSNFIVADSFHAMVFAIIFNKPFIIIGNKKRGLSRFISLLTILDLSERLIFSESDLTNGLLNKKIDWDHVNSLLDAQRIISINYLKNNLAQ